MSTKILVVDDHEIVRTGLTTLINTVKDLKVIGEASSAAEAIAKAKLLQPDIIIMDIRMPGGSGIEACREIVSEQPAIKVLMLTSHSDNDAVIGSIIAGAQGYILKQIGSEALIEAVHQVSQGKSLLDPSITHQVFEQIKRRCNAVEEIPDELTAHEEAILKLIALGKTNKEIAKEVFLSENTVRNYISAILSKLRLANRSQAAVYAARYVLKKD